VILVKVACPDSFSNREATITVWF